jgi:hypothetical protein
MLPKKNTEIWFSGDHTMAIAMSPKITPEAPSEPPSRAPSMISCSMRHETTPIARYRERNFHHPSLPSTTRPKTHGKSMLPIRCSQPRWRKFELIHCSGCRPSP